MTLTQSLLVSLFRSLLVATLATGPVIVIQRHFGRLQGKARVLRILLALTPVFVPELLTGFSWRLTAARMSAQFDPFVAAGVTEIIYFLLLTMRCIAIGSALILVFPENQSAAESLHLWEFLRHRILHAEWWRGWACLQLDGKFRPVIVTWSVMALTSFQEFETAALMQVDQYPISWTVWLFDAHALRQPLGESLKMLALPMLSQLCLIVPAGFVIVRSAKHSIDSRDFRRTVAANQYKPLAAADLLLWAIFGMTFAWPFMESTRELYSGFGQYRKNTDLFSQSLFQILGSAAFSSAAAVLAMILSSGALSLPQSRGKILSRKTAACVVLLIPGLCGSLVLSLSLLQVFQWPAFRLLYDTWLPLLAGLTFSVLPRAMAVVLLIRSTPGAARHLAELLSSGPDASHRRSGSSILWHLTTARWLLGGLLISHWCFWDVTASSILRPIEFEPVVNRLYNEMHYGRTEALVSLASLSALTPLTLWLLVLVADRLFRTVLVPVFRIETGILKSRDSQ